MITTTSARELLARASGRERVEPADARAGAVFERVTVGAESFFVKRPGAGPACWDLCWYLALNRARLPGQKEAAISRFRTALERHGIATAAWWQEQLDLCLAEPRS